jgi:hypothetical protein
MTKMVHNNKLPSCFSRLDTVFPKGKDGLRETPEKCLLCFHKTECLKAALQATDGLRVREELVDRAYASGVMSFLERWSQKKELRRRIEAKTKG